MKKLLLKTMLLLCALIVGGVSNAWGQTYKKVTAAPTDWSGEYLLVYESGSTAYVWTGVDAASCYSTATISSNTITKPDGAVSLTISSMTGGYSIKVNGGTNNGKYIKGTSGSNALGFDANAQLNTLAYESSSVIITSNTSVMRYNSAAKNLRFRYFKSSSYSSQQVVQLYKKVYTVTYNANGGTGTLTDSNSPYFMGSTVTTKTNTFTKDGYDFTGWNTAADGSGSDYAEGATFTPSANTTLYAQWALAGTVATPTFSVDEGTFNAAQSVEIECTTPSSTIYYTTDGTDPTTSSSVYSSAIAVNVTTTIKAIAVADGLDDSEIASATYTLKCATPEITIPSGPFVSSKVVTITSSDGATIRYTTDGTTTPTTSTGAAYDPANKPSISATTTIKAIAYKDGWSNSDVASETFTKETVLDGLSGLVAKTNTSDQSYYVNLTDAQVTYVNGKNGYMEDGTAGIYIYSITPTKNKVYNGIFQITYQLYNQMPELKAITAVEGEITDGSDKAPTEMTASDLKDDFAANLGRQIQITGHTTSTTTVLITGVNFYTTYYNPSFVADHVYTIIGYPYNNNGALQFRVISAVEKPEAPTISPAEGEFSSDFELTLSAVDGAEIRYTTDGSTTPTASVGSVYDPSDKPTISAGADVTVKAVAVKAGMTSDVASATYEYKAISKPTFSPVGGSSVYYGETVAIDCDVDGVTIYYTTDNSTPTSSSSVYSTPIAITDDMTIKAFAKNGGDESSVASASFTLKDPDAPEFSVTGAVPSGTVVTITSRTGTTIYYTTDGSDPDKAEDSGTNSVNVTITAATTLRAIAVDGALNISSETIEDYTILKVAPPTFTPSSVTFINSQEVALSCVTDGATIYYTTDGSTPTTSSTEYSAPFTVTSTTTVKAIAVKTNCTNSDVASSTYTKATIYTVADVINGTATGTVYVKGYIVGSYNATAPLTSTAVNTNFALADSYNEASGSNTIPVELPNKNSFRENWGPGANQHFIGVAQVIVNATVSSYFSVDGLKTTASITKVAEMVKVSSAGFATWASDCPLDFTDKDIDAYIAIAKKDGTGVTFTQVNKVPANTGVLLYKSGGATENIPIFDGKGADATTGNVFVKGPVASLDSESGSLHNYILNIVDDKIGFYRAAGQTVATNRAYIQIDESTLVKGFIAIDFNEFDGIRKIQDSSSKIQDAKIFNLAGQRMSKMQRGINIVNGKKILK